MKNTMKINKLQIPQDKFNINLKFYFFLKYLVKVKLSDNQANELFKVYLLNKSSNFESIVSKLIDFSENNLKEGTDKQTLLFEIINEMEGDIDLKLFIFSLNLYMIKDLLLQEAKLKNLLDTSKLDNLDPLSLEYDKITLYSPFSTRVNGALLSLIFFDKLDNNETNFISTDAVDFIKSLSKIAVELQANGVEPNQIFMLMFSESINQSIISDSGSNYEDRILSVLNKIGIPEDKIQKTHDKDDSSTEFDFFFEIKNRTYGIGTKRTLRERYKQFIKTAQMSEIDVMIEITLGLDLNEEKAKSIRHHGVYIFVSDEVYQSRKFLQKMKGVFSVRELNLGILNKL